MPDIRLPLFLFLAEKLTKKGIFLDKYLNEI